VPEKVRAKAGLIAAAARFGLGDGDEVSE